MDKIGFATLILPGEALNQGLLLTESLRQFGGKLAGSPVWAFVPESHNDFTPQERELLASRQVEMIPFPVDEDVLKFPFAAKVIAASAAEARAMNAVELLAFFDLDTLVLQEPVEMLLPQSISFGYRPVHHRLIGAPWSQPVDEFWSMIYERFQVQATHLFSMTTHTGEDIYPYYNCGTFVIRPALGLLKSWRDKFLNLYLEPTIQAYYQRDDKYAVFIHQVVFTAVMLAALGRDEIGELGLVYNYPLHLHEDVPKSQRPASIWELVTARYEHVLRETDWRSHPLVDEHFVEWMEKQRLIEE